MLFRSNEVPWNMWLPIAVLSIFALFMGWLGTPWFHDNLFHHYLAPEEHSPEHSNLVLWLSIGVGLFGIFLGWLIYGRKTMEHATDADPLAVKLGGLFTALNRKWYIDELYEATIIRLTMALGVFFRAVDKAVVDGILHAIAWVAWGISQVVRLVGDDLIINGSFDAGCDGVRTSDGPFTASSTRGPGRATRRRARGPTCRRRTRRGGACSASSRRRSNRRSPRRPS